jgi:hypothetical protein
VYTAAGELVRFIAGNQEISYQHLEDFDRFLARVGWIQQHTVDTDFANARGGMACFEDLRDILAALGHDNAHNRDHLRAIYGASTRQQIRYAVYAEVVARVRWRRVTDPRDVVYACLRMIVSSDVDVRVYVDYHLSVEEVYTQFAVLWVQEHSFLNVLSAREDVTARRFKDLPSWVPDFSQGISHNALVRSSDFYRDEQGINFVFGRRFNASKSAVKIGAKKRYEDGHSHNPASLHPRRPQNQQHQPRSRSLPRRLQSSHARPYTLHHGTGPISVGDALYAEA